ncbi:hypothetical protein [[Actinomadura] parvosata]|uniref:hypothetical protein n=1 Tax=[Actinomadura] parvosata TaxID=1955412 RepID=UPI001FEB30C0
MSDSSSSAELAVAMRAMIDRLAPGDRLPSSRELIRRYQVGPAPWRGPSPCSPPRAWS